jgi:antitoxin CptB
VSESAGHNRLRWRCRRGLLELDVLLGRFLECRYDSLAAAERTAFERLLRESDQTLSAWLNGQDRPRDIGLRNIVNKIR